MLGGEGLDGLTAGTRRSVASAALRSCAAAGAVDTGLDGGAGGAARCGGEGEA